MVRKIVIEIDVVCIFGASHVAHIHIDISRVYINGDDLILGNRPEIHIQKK